jgi:hypothetical protein
MSSGVGGPAQDGFYNGVKHDVTHMNQMRFHQGLAYGSLLTNCIRGVGADKSNVQTSLEMMRII